MTTHDDAPVVEHDAEPESTEQLRKEIEETRAELGETVEALAAKADVKGQIKEKVSTSTEQLKEKVSTGTEQVRETASAVSASLPEPVRQAAEAIPDTVRSRLPAIAGALGLLFVWRMIRRTRSK